MRKIDELSLPDSCINAAHDMEVVFVLLARDAAAPDAIRAWALRRVQLGLNKPDDAELVQAIGTADLMEEQRPEVRTMLNKKLSAADVAELVKRESGPQ